MSVIESYIQKVFEDFKKYVEENSILCDLRRVDFNCDEVMDYSVECKQLLYLLRYGFAYIFEYENMYNRFFIKYGKYYKSNIKVLSIGCGAMIDYGSLKLAIDNNISNLVVYYVGIDPISWIHKTKERDIDKVIHIDKSSLDLFYNEEKIKFDVIFLPKSISEIEDNEIIRICSKIDKDLFHIFISHRNNEKDEGKIDMIKLLMIENGFILKEDNSNYTGKGIITYDNKYKYPDEVIKYLKTLNEKCSEREICHDSHKCDSDGTYGSLIRSPILFTNHLHNTIITCKRMP